MRRNTITDQNYFFFVINISQFFFRIIRNVIYISTFHFFFHVYIRILEILENETGYRINNNNDKERKVSQKCNVFYTLQYAKFCLKKDYLFFLNED